MRLTRTLLLAVGIAALLGGLPGLGTSSVPTAAMTVAVAPVSAEAEPSQQGSANDVVGDLDSAQALLRELKADYRHLDGVTVSMGTTPNGEEAVAYYTEGRIVISRTHTVDIEKILAHEVWHIIDWRDNGKLDWQENVPPYNGSSYLRS